MATVVIPVLLETDGFVKIEDAVLYLYDNSAFVWISGFIKSHFTGRPIKVFHIDNGIPYSLAISEEIATEFSGVLDGLQEDANGVPG